jgi:hypothetical protein
LDQQAAGAIWLVGRPMEWCRGMPQFHVAGPGRAACTRGGGTQVPDHGSQTASPQPEDGGTHPPTHTVSTGVGGWFEVECEFKLGDFQLDIRWWARQACTDWTAAGVNVVRALQLGAAGLGWRQQAPPAVRRKKAGLVLATANLPACSNTVANGGKPDKWQARLVEAAGTLPGKASAAGTHGQVRMFDTSFGGESTGQPHSLHTRLLKIQLDCNRQRL